MLIVKAYQNTLRNLQKFELSKGNDESFPKRNFVEVEFWPILVDFNHDLSLIILKSRDLVANIENFLISPNVIVNLRKSSPNFKELAQKL